MTNAITESKQVQMKIKHITSELKEKSGQVKQAGKEYTQLQSEFDAGKKSLAQLKVCAFVISIILRLFCFCNTITASLFHLCYFVFCLRSFLFSSHSRIPSFSRSISSSHRNNLTI